MSNSTEQPIDPDKLGVWCDICQIRLIGFSNWEKHLISEEHRSKLK